MAATEADLYSAARTMSAVAAIHAGLRQLGIEEDDRRDLYERCTGKRTLTEMSQRDQESVLAELRRQGFKASKSALQGPFAKKLQALWIAAWNLGLVRDRRDEALLAFVKRQTGIDDTRFLVEAWAAAKVTEALKGWMARDGGVDWSFDRHLPFWKQLPGGRIAMAQWTMLAEARQVEAGIDAFRRFVEDHAFNPLAKLTPREWQGVMNTLGMRVRKARGL